ncbi:MAG: hypothetical protein Q7T55_10400 [Solirubrobacteraceae bacterium]|nr:hypothetical protein [Solirubrobacteraceae bacterium]
MPLDTVLRRASVASLLVLATALSACGDDTPSTADTSSGQSALNAPGGDVSQAPAGSTPEATTPKGSTPEKEEEIADDVKPLKGRVTNDEVPGGIKAKEFSPADQKKITDNFENAASIAAQPDKQYTQAQIDAQMKAVIKAAKSAGVTLKVKEPGEARNMGKLVSDNLRIMFFPSYRRATEVTRNYQQLISTRPGFGRADHFKTRMWIIVDEDGIKQKDLAAYRKLRARVEGEV